MGNDCRRGRGGGGGGRGGKRRGGKGEGAGQLMNARPLHVHTKFDKVPRAEKGGWGGASK